MTAALGYIPFLDPIHFFHEWWYLLLIPLCLGISIIYKAMRMHELRGYWREVSVMTLLTVVGMIAAAIGVSVFVQVVIPLIPVKP